MAHQFSNLTFTDDVAAVQTEMGSRKANQMLNQHGPANDTLTSDERAFIAARDGFYIATVNETGWPYIQFRGGPIGFLHILDDRTLAYADITGGNRQYITTGNLSAPTTTPPSSSWTTPTRPASKSSATSKSFPGAKPPTGRAN